MDFHRGKLDYILVKTFMSRDWSGVFFSINTVDYAAPHGKTLMMAEAGFFRPDALPDKTWPWHWAA